MPKFVALIYGDETAWHEGDRAAYDANMAAHEAFAAKHGASIVGGAELCLPREARTVRGATVTDGPFMETKEVLGGYYVLDVADLDAAVSIAKDIPEATIEVRPVVD
jgi:hypothetical protein